MDDIDREILKLLESDGRISLKELSARTNVSDVTVKNRIEKLISLGIIQNFTLEINYEKMGLPLRVTIGITVEPMMTEKVLEHIQSFKEIFIIWKTSGAHNINIRGAFHDHNHMNQVLDKALNINGVREYHISILDRVVKASKLIFL